MTPLSPPAHLTKEERIVWEANHAGQTVAAPAAPIAPKPKFVPSPEHLAKLAAARAEYQRKLKAGEIQPPSRKPKPPVEEPVAPAAAPVSSVKTGSTTFANTKIRWEFMVRDGNFDTDPIPCIYVTEVRGSIKENLRGHYLIEDTSGRWLTAGGKWVEMSYSKAIKDESIRIYWEGAPRFNEVCAALKLVGLELDMEFTL